MTSTTYESVSSRPACRLRFGIGGNDSDHLAEGWSSPEDGFRWALGARSSLKLPRFEGLDVALLTVVVSPARTPTKPVQQILAHINGQSIGIISAHTYTEQCLTVPRGLLRDDEENLLTFYFSHAAFVGELNPREDRPLAAAFYLLQLDRMDLEVFEQPRLLPPAKGGVEADVLRTLAERFESLGQNCEFGMWQRRCGAEPLGLLRFASARIGKVLQGLRSEFSGIGDAARLTMNVTPAGEYMGHHADYELDYHTFRNEGTIDLPSFLSREPQRLAYLARELIQHAREGDRIFVVQREHHQLTQPEVLPLLRCLRQMNAHNRLLYVSPLGPDFHELRGIVHLCGPGFFHGFVERLAPGSRANDFEFDDWLSICAAVAAASDTS